MLMFIFDKVPKVGFVDIHTHIIPGVDDGATDMATSMAMVNMAYESGTRVMVATSHFHPSKVFCTEDEIVARFEELKQKVYKKMPDMDLYFGRELFCDHRLLDVINLPENKFKFCDSRQVLIEFDPTVDYIYMTNMIRQVQCKGYFPILAHCERYECLLKRPERVEEIADMNVKIQVNASSVAGDNGKHIQKFVFDQIKDNYIDVVASDAHSIRRRNPRMDRVATVLTKKFGSLVARDLLIENPQRIIDERYMEEE